MFLCFQDLLLKKLFIRELSPSILSYVKVLDLRAIVCIQKIGLLINRY